MADCGSRRLILLIIYEILRWLYDRVTIWVNRLKPGDRLLRKEQGVNGYGQPRTGTGYDVAVERDPNGSGSPFYSVKLDGAGEEVGVNRDELTKMN